MKVREIKIMQRVNERKFILSHQRGKSRLLHRDLYCYKLNTMIISLSMPHEKDEENVAHLKVQCATWPYSQ